MRHLTYSYAGSEEQLLAFGPENAAARILIIPPLFVEMNRMRSTLVAAMRKLANAGIAGALPDLPGSNESMAKLESQSLSDWHGAMTAAAEELSATHIFSIRGGSLIDDGSDLPILRLAPAKGKSILNLLIRTRMAGDKEMGRATTAEQLSEQAATEPVELAGNNIGPALWRDLQSAIPVDDGKAQEIKPADIDGAPLWMRAEPQHHQDMAEGLARKLAEWVAA